MATREAQPTTERTWEDVCNDPTLQDLPYKIETNAYGQIVMSPTHLKHGAFQSTIATQLMNCTSDGRVVTEAAVETEDGIKGPMSRGSLLRAGSRFTTTTRPPSPLKSVSKCSRLPTPRPRWRRNARSILRPEPTKCGSATPRAHSRFTTKTARKTAHGRYRRFRHKSSRDLRKPS